MAQHEADELFRLVAGCARPGLPECRKTPGDGIHFTDGEGKVLFINKAYTRRQSVRRTY